MYVAVRTPRQKLLKGIFAMDVWGGSPNSDAVRPINSALLFLNASTRNVLMKLFALVLVFGFTGVARAGLGGTTVQYSPQSQGLTLTIPATSSYDLTVSPPTAYTAFPVTVRLRLVPQNIPLGDAATAASYIQFSTPTLTFTAAGQKQVVTVTMSFPANAVNPNVINPHYTYAIYSDGWAAGFADNGAAISAGLLVPVINPNSPSPPQVAINNPADASQVTVPPTAFPAPVPFQFTASTDSISPVITSVSATLVDPSGVRTPLAFTTTGFGTALITGNGTLTVPAPGSYSVQVDVANSVGPARDINTFTVVTGTAPPAVAISSPVLGSSYSYRLGAAPTPVILSFTGHSSYAIRTLTAVLDSQNVSSQYTPSGIGTTDASGSFTIGYTTAGAHTLTVTATDDYGTASTSTNYTINVIAPVPTINIGTPAEGQMFTIPYPGTSLNVPFTFVTTSNNGFVVDSVSAKLNGNPVSVTTAGLGTANANSSGTFSNLAPGSYTFTANGSSAGLPVTQTVHFTVQAGNPPPAVVINSPAANATFTRFSSDPALTIPMTFTGTSNAPGGVITAVTATLDGVPLTVTAALNTKVVSGAATMSVLAAGTHTIKVTATDFVGTATAVQTFTVTIFQGYNISGTTFFDVDSNGAFGAAEFGLSGVALTLRSTSGQTLGTTTSAADGTFTFSKLVAGTYTVAATAPAGLAGTAGLTRTVVVAKADVSGVTIGFMIDFCALQGKAANGYSSSYWKYNIDKSIFSCGYGSDDRESEGSCYGRGFESECSTIIPAATIAAYTKTIGSFALAPYDNITAKGASAVLGSCTTAPIDVLSKQVLTAEYNFQNKAYLGGNGMLTYLFVWWGEYIVSHPTSYSTTYVVWAKNWFTAYNATHGCGICGPALIGTSCTGGPGTASSGSGSCSEDSRSSESGSGRPSESGGDRPSCGDRPSSGEDASRSPCSSDSRSD